MVCPDYTVGACWFCAMGTFLISGINGVRIAEHPRSDAPHDRLEFRGTVRGWQQEERQEWTAKLLGEGEQWGGRGEDLMEKLIGSSHQRDLIDALIADA